MLLGCTENARTPRFRPSLSSCTANRMFTVFGLPVWLPVVVTLLEPHVIPADSGEVVPCGRHRDDASPVAGGKRGHSG
jgi:hypothetical protein